MTVEELPPADLLDAWKAVTEQALRVLKGYEIPLSAVLVTKMDRIRYDQAAFGGSADLTPSNKTGH